MSKVLYRPTSQYATTSQTSWYLGLLNYQDIPSDSTDKAFVITRKYHEKPHLLSYDLYGTTDYWWVFMVRNPDSIKDPIYDLKEGMTIMTPTLDHLTRVQGR